MDTQDSDPTVSGSPAFTTTHWSLVLASQATEPARSAAALEELCRRYWFPLYAFVRRRGHAPDDAQDLTQAFFEHLISHRSLHQVDRRKGRFRTFLLTAFGNFANDHRDKQRALKRGGGIAPVSWDELEAEDRFGAEPPGALPPEAMFDRDWAIETLNQSLAQLRREQPVRGNAAAFAKLEPYLTGEPPAGFYEAAARELGKSEPALRVEVHRLRQRLGELLRDAVAATVASPQDVGEEIRYLRDLLAG